MAVDLNVMATNIQSILSGVAGVAIAYDHEPQNLQQLPAATVYFDSFTEREETMGRLQYEWKWTIRIYVPISVSDVGPGQLQVRTITTAALLAFRTRANLSLNGSCMFSSISAGDIYNVLSVSSPMMVAEFTLVATTQESLM